MLFPIVQFVAAVDEARFALEQIQKNLENISG